MVDLSRTTAEINVSGNNNTIYQMSERPESLTPQRRIFAISKVIKCIASNTETSKGQPKNYNPYEIAEKISYNDASHLSHIWELFRTEGSIIELAYDEIDESSLNTKKMVLDRIYRQYSKFLAKTPNNGRPRIDVVRENSSQIVYNMIDWVKGVYHEHDLVEEEIDYCAHIIVAHAFVECKILENPNDPS